jgi:hypothetical protein
MKEGAASIHGSGHPNDIRAREELRARKKSPDQSPGFFCF